MGGSLTGSAGTSIDTSWMGAQPSQGRALNFQNILNQGQQASDQLWNQQQGYVQQVQGQLASSPWLQQAQTLAALAPSQTQPTMIDAENQMARLSGQTEALAPALGGLAQGMTGYAGQAGRMGDAMAGQGSLLNRSGANIENVAYGQQGLSGLLNAQAVQALSEGVPSSIENKLYADAEAELAMGRALSPEQERQAAQSARAAMQARGLATSNAGAAAEILNRDAYGTARQDARRSFAGAANQMRTDNVLKRRQSGMDMANTAGQSASNVAGMFNAAGGMYGNAANVYGGAASSYGNAGSLLSGAGGLYSGMGNLYGTSAGMQQNRGAMAAQRGAMSLDQSQRLQAMDPIANAYGLAGSMAANTTGAGRDYAGNIASFNTNRQDQLYNNWMNNQAAVSSANAQLAASNASNNSNMFGALGGLLGTAAGAAAAPYTGGTSLYWGPALGSAAGYAVGR